MIEKAESAEGQPDKPIAEEHLLVPPRGSAQLSDGQLEAVWGCVAARYRSDSSGPVAESNPVPRRFEAVRLSQLNWFRSGFVVERRVTRPPLRTLSTRRSACCTARLAVALPKHS